MTVESLLNGELKKPENFKNFPKVINSRKGNKWCLKDKANKRQLSDYFERKFSKQEISLVQFRLEILRVNSGL